MINSIRSQFKQSTYRYVIFFIIFALALGMVSLPILIKNEKTNISWIAKVNGRKISYQDFAREVAERSEWLSHIRSQYGQYADMLLQAMNISTDPKALALEMLIKESLINQYSEKIGVAVHPDYIAQAINDRRYAQQYLGTIVPSFVFDESGTLNLNKLKVFLQHIGLSVKAFEQKVEHALVRLQGMQFIESASYVPAFDSKQEYIATQLGKQFTYITFSLDSFLAQEKKKTISDEELLSFYSTENKQRRRYWVPEKRNGIMWKFDAKNYNASISEEEIARYYEDNKVSKYVLDPIKVQVNQITEKQIAQLTDLPFEAIREELLNDSLSEWNKQWKTVQPFARGDKKNALEREAFLLQNVGDISPIIETAEGKVVIQLVKRISRTYKPLAEVKNEIKATLTEKYFKKNFVKDLKAIILKDDQKSIESFLSQKTAKKEMIIGLMKNDTPVARELFGLEQKGEYSFFVEKDTGYVVQLTDIEERHLPAIETIKDVVKDDYWHSQAEKEMINTVKQAQEAALTLSFDEIQKEFGGVLHHTDMIKPTDNKKIQSFEAKEFPVREVLSLDKVGIVLTHNTENASMLIMLDAIEPYNDNMLLDAQNEMTMRSDSMRTKLQLESFVASLHRNATIETNEPILIANEEYSE